MLLLPNINLIDLDGGEIFMITYNGDIRLRFTINKNKCIFIPIFRTIEVSYCPDKINCEKHICRDFFKLFFCET